MGYKVGTEIADSALTIQEKLSWHLTGNHVPPVDELFIPVAMAAIERANTNNWDELLTLPNEVERTVLYIIQGLHLEPFVSTIDTPEED